MLPYFPLQQDIFKMVMGVQALNDERLVDVDEACYQDEISLKRGLLSAEYQQYVQALPGTSELQWDMLALLLPAMASAYPQHFTLSVQGRCWTWRNILLGEETSFVFGEDISLSPLDWLGRQVQEDLLLLSGSTERAMPLVAGHLCFPNDWCLDDKMGKTFLGIHESVPLFAEHLGRSSRLLLERLKAGRPVWRVNWSIKATSRLNLLPRFSHEERQAHSALSLENIGERCFFRIERQTLSRLPTTNGILFTVHTYQTPLMEVANDVKYARRLASVVRTMPDELRIYKGIAPFVGLLLAYFASNEV